MSLLAHEYAALHTGQINSLFSGVNFYQFFVGFLIMYAGTVFLTGHTCLSVKLVTLSLVESL